MKNKCSKCGEKISPGYDLCLSCSYKFLRESRQIPTISDKKVEKSFRICPHCRQKLPLGAKFCVTCGQKVKELKPIPPTSAIKGRNAQIHLNWLKHQYYDLGKTMQDIANDQNVSMMTIRKLLERIEAISEKEEVKSMIDVPTLKTEEVQPIPQVSDIKEETPKIIPIEEVKPRPPVLEKKVEEPKKSSDVQFFPPISELLQGEKTSKPIPSVSELKTEDTQTASSISEKKVKKSFTTCPHCRQKLHLRAKFCFNCGQKVEVLKPIPSISEKIAEKSFRTCPHCRQKLPLGAKFCVTCGQKVEVLKPIPPISAIKGRNGQINLNWLKHQYYDLERSIQDIADDRNVNMITIRKLLDRIEAISKKKEVESMTDVPPLTTEEVQTAPPVLDIKEEMPKITPVEEIQPIPPVYVKKEEKRKKEPRVCKFCGMRLPKNKAFCLQCGMIIKIK
ncbi:hypothetical protein ES703_92540 [subsurface metagenome]